MDAIKKKMASLREKLESAEGRSKKAEDELIATQHKSAEVMTGGTLGLIKQVTSQGTVLWESARLK